ncbi:uncharacterized protein LOC124173058 [Ischnura elegans]|uniref:uncharacterized protein LOC124173058 n=1 Tax=Ischnura elegans TaxID=197161 RepID=UPI001ED8920D|nr:uncharacterized protein LOC124173058 [Ischnura elegans]
MQPSKRSRKFRCSICQQEYIKIEEIRAHIKGTHLKHLTCPVCDRMFLDIFELTNHKKLHFQPAPDHLFQPNESIPQATVVKDEIEDKKPPTNVSKESNLPCNDRPVKAEGSTPSLTLNAGSIDLKTKFQTHQSASCNNQEMGAIDSSRLNNAFKGSSSNQRASKIHLAELESGKSLKPHPCLPADDTNERSSFICNGGREKVTHQSSSSIKIVFFPRENHWKVGEIGESVRKEASILDEGKRCALLQDPGLEIGNSLKRNPQQRADDAEDISPFRSNKKRVQLTHNRSPSMEIVCFPRENRWKVREVSESLRKEASILLEGKRCALLQDPGLENGNALKRNPQQRADDAEDISPFRSNEKRAQQTHNRSSSTEIVCFPRENHWGVAKVSDAVSSAAALPMEAKCGVEEGESACGQSEEGSEEAAAGDEEGERDGRRQHSTPPFREVGDEKPKAMQDALENSLGIKYTNSTSECYLESKTEADDKKMNPKETTATLKMANASYYIIPLNDIKLIRMTNMIQRPSSDGSTSFYTVDGEGVNAKYAKPLEYTCNVCKEKYSDVDSLQSHMKEAHASHLKCLFCDETFAAVSEYLSHSKSHLNIPSPKSKDIGSYDGNIGDHTRSDPETSGTTNVEMGRVLLDSEQQKESKLEKVKEYKCKLCSEKTSNLNEMRIHVKEFHLKRFTCGLCKLRFTDKYSLMVHTESHPRTIKYGDSSANISSAMPPKNVPADHFDGTLDEESRGSKYSDAGFMSESGTEFQVREKAYNKCGECNLYFDSETALQSHAKTHKKTIYKCGVCGLSSPSKKLLLEHLKEKGHSVSVECNEGQ